MFGSWKRSLERLDGPQNHPEHPYDPDPTDGIAAVRLRGPWDPRMSKYLLQKDIRGLYLDPGKGFACDDYSFLQALTHLELLSVAQPRPFGYDGPMPISQLTNLRRLSAVFEHRQPVDFPSLAKLESCSVRWNSFTKSLFDSLCLKRLQLTGLNWKKADGLARLTTLSNLELAHSGIRSFAPLSALTGLERLSLSVCRQLENLDGIEHLTGLRWLGLEEVHKVPSLERLRPLTGLEALVIVDCGDIESLAPLADLQNLKAVAFAGTRTKILDGDLSVLTRLPKLAMLMFGHRRHYSHRLVKPWNWKNLEQPDRLLEPV